MDLNNRKMKTIYPPLNGLTEKHNKHIAFYTVHIRMIYSHASVLTYNSPTLENTKLN